MSRILFISKWFPYPSDNGSKIRVYNLLRGLGAEHQVTLLSFTDQRDVNYNATAMRDLCRCREVDVLPWKPFDPRDRRARLGFLSPIPRSVVDTFSPEMKQLIQRTLSAKDYDLVIASQTTSAAYAPFFGRLPALFEELEASVFYEQFTRATSTQARIRYGLTWAKHRRYLAHLLPYYRACTVVSEPERELLRAAAPGYQAVEVIPNCINLADYANVHRATELNTLIFTGSFRYYANHDAMVWFLREIYPRIQSQIPDVRLTITGDHANLPLPAAENVVLTGFVDDVRSRIAASAVSIAPIRLGGGTRMKIIEAMALRTAVVATSKGVEGLDARHDEHLLIADAPDAFAQAVVRLLGDPALRQRLADNAYRLIQQKYDWAVVMPHFLDLVERVAQAKPLSQPVSS